jgi:ubiquinone/menaquinone biosynthesis C-methylase UbiE
MLADGRRKVKAHFQEFFSKPTEIDYWESAYNRADFTGVIYRERMNQALTWLDGSGLPENSTILDAGCGPGIVAHEVAKRGYKVLGMDYSHNMVERARSVCNSDENLDIEFLQGDIESMPFEDSSFDMILCLGVITYLESEEKALVELSRVLRPHGILILSSINKLDLARCLDLPLLVKWALRKVLGSRIRSRRREARIKNGSDEQTVSIRRYFTPKLRKSLELRGFKVLEHTTIPLQLLTFFGRKIPPERINVKITMLLGRFSNIPLLGPLGGMCIFKLRKSAAGDTR